jgi:porin
MKLGVSVLLCLALMSSSASAGVIDGWSSTKSDWEEKGITAELLYVGEFWSNVGGGTKEDETYLGTVDLMLTFDTEKLGLWDNGTFFVYGVDAHGGEKLTGEIVGDTQGASSIEGSRSSRILELWYEHQVSNATSVLLGIHDANGDFGFPEYAGVFSNGSFGLDPVLGGGRIGTYPIASPGVRIKHAVNDRWTSLLGVYDGDPDDAENEEHFVRSDFDSDGGVLILLENQFTFGEERDIPDTVKLGVWHNTGDFADVVEVNGSGDAILREGNTGLYVIVDKHLAEIGDGGSLGSFVQFAAASEDQNEVDYYAGAGLVLSGFWAAREHDECGIAVNHIHISDKISGRENTEIVVEASYVAPITENLTIMPNYQFITNPGAVTGVGDASVLGLRFELML